MSPALAPPPGVTRAWVEHGVETLIGWLDALDAPAAELEDGGDWEPEEGF